MTTVTQQMIVNGLQSCGLDQGSAVIVHSSLRSFGYVEGGALTVCRALLEVCGTVMMPAGCWESWLPAPPGLVRPHNAVLAAASWEEFDQALAEREVFHNDLPIDVGEFGQIPETLRQNFPHRRGIHPLLSFVAVGQHASELIAAQRLDWPLGPLEALAAHNGYVVLLGVGHNSNTAIHLAEQRLGRARFYRYVKAAHGIWMELPNIPGDSHRFNAIAPALASATRTAQIGGCLVQCIAITDVLAVTEQLIIADPAALLCDDPECRCGAALQQRLAALTL